MNEKMAFQPKAPETNKDDIKENILKKIKRMAFMGIAVSTLLMNACKNESNGNNKDEKGQENSFDMHTLKTKIDKSKTAELSEINTQIENLGIELFNELKNQNLLEVNKDKTHLDDTVYNYKNWSFHSPVRNFKDVDTKGVDISWKSDEKNQDGTFKEGYSYLSEVNENNDNSSSTVIHYSHPNLQSESYNEFWNSGSGEVWQTMVDKKNSSQVLGESEITDVYVNATHSFAELESKLQKEVNSHDSPNHHLPIQNNDLNIHEIKNNLHSGDPSEIIPKEELILPHTAEY